jgi:hypothetical protein
LLLLLKWSNQPGVVENADDAFLFVERGSAICAGSGLV